MKKRIQSYYLIVSSFVIAILHLPFAFAKTVSGQRTLSAVAVDTAPVSDPGPAPAPVPLPAPSPLPVAGTTVSVYDSLHLDLKGLSEAAFDYAKEGFDKLVQQGRVSNDHIISICDFSLPSNKKRLFIIDLKNYRVLFNTLVSHGRNTGYDMATAFSNQSESYKSSPGFYVTRGTYEGKNGYSLKLDGLEAGINDNAYNRGIVVHGAPYVNEANANAGGFVGRSQGCPAVPVPLSRPIINTIRNGSCLFIYHPAYVKTSRLLRA